ncbi:MAG: thioredoxin family protein [Proteobacteria bacterium]|nr:thioredoxin family protein [Pseudomonadota bacterium]
MINFFLFGAVAVYPLYEIYHSQHHEHLLKQPFSIKALEEYRLQGKPVFVNVTAAWCLTCKFNEAAAFDTKKVQSIIKEKGIIYMVADWTTENPEITHYLASFGRSGVPLYVYYPYKKEPIVLPQLLNETTVLEVLRN